MIVLQAVCLWMRSGCRCTWPPYRQIGSTPGLDRRHGLWNRALAIVNKRCKPAILFFFFALIVLLLFDFAENSRYIHVSSGAGARVWFFCETGRLGWTAETRSRAPKPGDFGKVTRFWSEEEPL